VKTRRRRLLSLSSPFILRPVATILLAVGIALLGGLAFALLPVSPLPQVTVPTISIQADLPGAGPETMAQSVATPLERQLARIPGVTDMTSKSDQGSTSIALQFDLDRDIDGAARDVQAAINAARAQLPAGMPSSPSYRKVNPADTPILVLALTSKSLTPEAIYDAASAVVAQKISQVRGVGNVTIAGASPPAVRIDLNPTALSSYGIALSTVRTAVQNDSANRPLGLVETGDMAWQIHANDQQMTASQYRNLVVKSMHGGDVHLSDVADVTDSVEDIRNTGYFNGERAVLVVVNKQPDANILETVGHINDLLPSLRASIPEDIGVDVAIERTTTIRASLRDAEVTLLISMLLVLGVVFVFIHDWRAAVIPAVVVPMSLLATFAAMYACGYSLNNFSLMALIVATGFVVDDVVVVLENISRHMEKGTSALRAALLGSNEIGFTVVSMSLSLIAVFIPIIFFPGVVGRYFREFAMTLSFSVVFSLLLSLTVAPMLCARILVRRAQTKKGSGAAISETATGAIQRFYERTLKAALSRPLAVMFVLFAMVGLNVYLYMSIDKGFFPPEDTGRMYSGIQADQAVSFQSYKQKMVEFMKIIKSDPAVDSIAGSTSGAGDGLIFSSLKPWGERGVSTAEVASRLKLKLKDAVPGASIWVQPAHDIRIGARPSDGSYQYTLQSDNLDDLRMWAPKVEAAFDDLPQLEDVSGEDEIDGLDTSLRIDRTKAARLGLTMDAIDNTLSDAFSQRQVATIYGPLNQYHVVMGLAPRYLQSPEALKNVYVQASSGSMVPLAAFANFGSGLAPLTVSHQNQFVASTLSFDLAKGVTFGEARAAIDEAMAILRVPASVHGGFQGTAQEAERSLASLPWLIGTALIAIYVVLGILYESFVHPLTILSTLPSAGVGALIALKICGAQFTLIAFIGVLLLIGLVKKNAIMMIDFALDAERRDGLSARDAIFLACSCRFRPIMMTTLAALLSALPLVVESGEGRELRQPLGISILGGLILSQLLTLYSTPVVYLYLDRFRQWSRGG
jgi:multidrug efflux pump